MKKYIFSALVGLFIFGIIPCPISALSSNALKAQKEKKQLSEFNADEAKKAIEKLAKELEDNFIYPDIGKAYATMLRGKLSSGAYANFESAEKFAQAVTADLQATHPEGHLRLQPPTPPKTPGNSANATPRQWGVGKYGWLAPEVGYMSFHGFSGGQDELNKVIAKIKTVLDELSSAKTLIIDARSHPGGGLDEMDAMFSYFYEQPTTLVMMDTRLEVEKRGGNPLGDSATLKRTIGPEGIVRRVHVTLKSDKNISLGKAKIFLLTSKKTASAGEHLALSLKRTERATLIGETTYGAGHFGRTTALGGGYRAFIPVGRTFDPDTDKGWEQTGVELHIKVPADQAFDEAVRLARIDPDAAKKALESFKIQ